LSIIDGGSLVIDDGELIIDGGVLILVEGSIDVEDGAEITITNDGALIIDGGTLTVEDGGDLTITSGTLDLNDGTLVIEGDMTVESGSIVTVDGGDLVIDGGEVTVVDAVGGLVVDSGTVSVEGSGELHVGGVEQTLVEDITHENDHEIPEFFEGDDDSSARQEIEIALVPVDPTNSNVIWTLKGDNAPNFAIYDASSACTNITGTEVDASGGMSVWLAVANGKDVEKGDLTVVVTAADFSGFSVEIHVTIHELAPAYTLDVSSSPVPGGNGLIWNIGADAHPIFGAPGADLYVVAQVWYKRPGNDFGYIVILPVEADGTPAVLAFPTSAFEIDLWLTDSVHIPNFNNGFPSTPGGVIIYDEMWGIDVTP
jgi:adhesin HecA-like repeat protein